MMSRRNSTTGNAGAIHGYVARGHPHGHVCFRHCRRGFGGRRRRGRQRRDPQVYCPHHGQDFARFQFQSQELRPAPSGQHRHPRPQPNPGQSARLGHDRERRSQGAVDVVSRPQYGSHWRDLRRWRHEVRIRLEGLPRPSHTRLDTGSTQSPVVTARLRRRTRVQRRPLDIRWLHARPRERRVALDRRRVLDRGRTHPQRRRGQHPHPVCPRRPHVARNQRRQALQLERWRRMGSGDRCRTLGRPLRRGQRRLQRPHVGPRRHEERRHPLQRRLVLRRRRALGSRDSQRALGQAPALQHGGGPGRQDVGSWAAA